MSRATKNVAPPPPLLPSADDRAAAQDPSTPPDRLRKLARKHRHKAVAALVAANPSASPELLGKLARSRSWYVRAAVAGNPSTSPEVVERLASDEQWAVRYNVAASPQLTAKTARLLLKDYPPVRLQLAANPAVPPDVVTDLAQDGDPWVQGQTASHPTTDERALRQLAEDLDGSAWVLNQIVANEACPPDLVDQLAVWTALGGGSGDPDFDPLTCEGNPGDDDYPATAFRRLARSADRHRPHALSAVRCQRNPDRPPNTEEVNAMLGDPLPRVRAVALQRTPSLFIPTKKFIVDHDPDPEVVAAAERFTTQESKGERTSKMNFWLGIGIFFVGVVVISLLPDADSTPSISSIPSITFPTLSTIERPGLFSESAETPGGATLAVSSLLTSTTVTVTVTTGANSIEILSVDPSTTIGSSDSIEISRFFAADSGGQFTFERGSTFFTVEFIEEGERRSVLLATVIPFTLDELPTTSAPTITLPSTLPSILPSTQETSSP